MKHLPIQNEEYENLLKNFGGMIQAKGFNKHAAYYPTMIREFFFFLESKGIFQIKEVTAHDLIGYYEYLRERPNQRREGGLSEAMIHSHLYSLRLLFDHLVETGIIKNSPARLPKFQMGTYQSRTHCTLEEIKQLYSVCETKKDRALLGLAYGCGLRRKEIYRLNFSDINFHKGTLTIRKAKNNKTRTIPVSDQVLIDLKEYLTYERRDVAAYYNSSCDSFLLDTKGDRSCDYLLNKRIKFLVQKTNNHALQLKNVTLHSLRHSIATHLIEAGADIEFVKTFLGHSLIDTTIIYCKRRKQRPELLEYAMSA